MRKKIFLLFIAATTTLLSGCLVHSFYPLYTEDELIRDDRIIGTWESSIETGMHSKDDTLVWKIDLKDKKWKKKQNNLYDRGSREIPNYYTYRMYVHSKDNPDDSAEFSLHLVKLKDNIYIDLFPEDYKITNSMFGFHVVFAHSFAKLNINEQITLNWFDSDWVSDLIDKNRIRIKHEKNSAFTLLTAKPKELQKFVNKYGSNPKAFEDGFAQTLVRINSSNEEISN